jgi:hemoglobin/transferrin/lactoferrin receptor protein
MTTPAATGRFIAAAVLAAPFALQAQESPGGGATALDAVTSTATRAARPLAEVPATVTVIDSRQLERQNAVRPQDAVRYEPGVSFSNNPIRGGGGNFVIRGIGDNRVRVLTDGVRLPDFPESNIGAGTFTRDFVDLENVRRLEIVRGPASALYGSDAIGGVVNYITKDPSDYLDAVGRNWYAALRTGYSGADLSFSESLTAAARHGDVDVLGIYTRRDGHEIQPNGNLAANGQDYTVNSFLGRAVWRATPVDTFRLTGEIFVRETETDLRTDRSTTGSGAAATTVQSSLGDDTTTRGRLQLDYSRNAPVLFADSMDLNFHWSRLDRSEVTTQRRYVGAGNPATSAANRLRYTETEQIQSIFGADLQLRNAIEAFGTTHRLTYGFSIDRIETSRPRDRSEVNTQTGVVSTTISGETYPNKNFPDTTTHQAGLYLQDEFSYGRFTFLPALRLDTYSLRASVDADFLRSAQSGAAVSVRDLDAVALSPKLGITYRLDDTYSLYGQYARGFRAPPYDTANFGFTNRTFGYTIIPNGDLQPEYVDSFEGGLRGRFADGSSFQVAAFFNRYTDFITTRTLASSGGLQVFQYQNIGNAQIYGAEARGEFRVTPSLRVRASSALAIGENLETDRPLDGVDPARGALGIAWQGENGLGLEANLTGALRNRRTADATAFKAPAYAVLDLAARYDFNESVTVNAGLFNVTNARYFLTSDVAGLASNAPLRDLYAQPGRYAAVNMTIRF